MTPPAVTGAPHVRGAMTLTRMQLLQAAALTPVVIAAVVNTGRQYLLALEAAWGMGADDWRDRAVSGLGVEYGEISLSGSVMAGLVHLVPILLVAVAVGWACELAFATWRRRPVEKGFLLTALVFVLLLPPAASPLHVALGMAFAMVFGKGVFGGEGKTFLNPALLAMAVVQISFPSSLSDHPLWTGVAGYSGTIALDLYHQDGMEALVGAGTTWKAALVGTTQGMMGTTSIVAVALGGALLVWKRIASWQLIAAHVLGLVAAAVGVAALIEGPGLPWHWHLMLGSFAFGAVFVATDPASSACTPPGRWIQGLLAGALVVVIRTLNPSHPDGVVQALLMGSILAPLIDHGVAWFNIRGRVRRHG